MKPAECVGESVLCFDTFCCDRRTPRKFDIFEHFSGMRDRDGSASVGRGERSARGEGLMGVGGEFFKLEWCHRRGAGQSCRALSG